MDNEKNCGCGHDHDHACECGHDHDHECGCGEHEFEHMVVDLEDENGNIISCPIVDAFEFEGAEYVLAQDPEGDSTYLFRSTEEGELIVPEEAEFDKVANYYSSLADEE